MATRFRFIRGDSAFHRAAALLGVGPAIRLALHRRLNGWETTPISKCEQNCIATHPNDTKARLDCMLKCIASGDFTPTTQYTTRLNSAISRLASKSPVRFQQGDWSGPVFEKPYGDCPPGSEYECRFEEVNCHPLAPLGLHRTCYVLVCGCIRHV
jgi:hypothetical protein